MVRKSVKTVGNGLNVIELKPKDADEKHTGLEPKFITQPEERGVALAKGFTWYHTFYGRKEAKTLLIQYLTMHDRIAEAKLVSKVDENQLRVTLCWLARMNLRGLQLTDHEQIELEKDISRLTGLVNDAEKAIPRNPESSDSMRRNVQEIMRERASEAAGELEGMLDDYITQGSKAQHSFKPIDILVKKNILPQHVSMVADVWKKKQAEFEEIIKGKDAQLVQGYEFLNKNQIKNLIKFADQVLTDLNSYVSIKKTAKAPRARKAVPIEKIVSRLKYLKEFKDPTIKLSLTSISPVKLHGASEAWCFDVKKRKAYHFVADDHSKTFTVKGNTLLGFDTSKSEVKTLRKPTEQIKELMGSKPAARKYFSDIRAVATAPNGRFNENMIILRSF